MDERPTMNKRYYLGDGLYVEYNPAKVILAANNGVEDVSVVYLTPDVLRAFLEFAIKLDVTYIKK